MSMTKTYNPIHHSFVTTEAEDEVIQKKMKLFGIRNKSTFFRAMILNGYISLEKTLMLGKTEGRRRRGREGERVGWHHRFDGHEFE